MIITRTPLRRTCAVAAPTFLTYKILMRFHPFRCYCQGFLHALVQRRLPLIARVQRVLLTAPAPPTSVGSQVTAAPLTAALVRGTASGCGHRSWQRPAICGCRSGCASAETPCSCSDRPSRRPIQLARRSPAARAPGGPALRRIGGLFLVLRNSPMLRRRRLLPLGRVLPAANFLGQVPPLARCVSSTGWSTTRSLWACGLWVFESDVWRSPASPSPWALY